MALATLALLLAAQAGGQSDSCGWAAAPGSATPAAYAAAKDWFINNEAITYRAKRFVKYGLPRDLVPGDVRYLFSKDGVPIMVEPEVKTVEVIYAYAGPSDSGCQFQPYQVEVAAHPARRRHH